jgi:hypothetical protein
MKLTFEISPDLDMKFKLYLLKKHGTTYRVQQLELQKALELYLDQFAKAPPIHEEKPEKRGKGPAPLEVRDPDLAAKIVAFYGAGKRAGGHSRSETALEFGLSEGQIDKIIRREMERIK